VQIVDEVYDAKTAAVFGVAEGTVTLMIHCGSRGLGHQVCDDFIRVMLHAAQKYGIELPDKQLCCAPLASPEGKDYLAAMAGAANFAFANRQIITHWVRETFEQALRMADGLVVISHESPSGDWKSTPYSEHYACPRCNVSIEELTPRLFSFNSPYGACPKCHGLGAYQEFDEDLVVPNPSLSLAQGAIAPWKEGPRKYRAFYGEALARFVRDFGADPDVPFQRWPKRQRALLLHGHGALEEAGGGPPGDGPWDGVLPSLKHLYEGAHSPYMKKWLEGFMSRQPCPACQGSRLRSESRSVRVGGRSARPG
jgi:excinuclease UvrABC ATPase subunit